MLAQSRSLRGIYGEQRNNITVRNGTVQGFLIGVFLYDPDPFTTSQGNVVEDIRAVNNINSGIKIYGTDNIVRRNNVLNTGYPDSNAASSIATGIYVAGAGIRVIDNDISQTASRGSHYAYAIHMENSNGAVVEGNRINDVTSDEGVGWSYGLAINTSTSVLVVGNRISNVSIGVGYGGGTGKYMNNLTYNVDSGFLGGTPVGLND